MSVFPFSVRLLVPMSPSDHDNGDGDHSGRALRRRPNDVSGQHETPDQFLNLETGDTVGERFVVRRYIGSSGGATSFLCEDTARDTLVVLKMLEIEAPESLLEGMRSTIRQASEIRQRNLTSIIGMGATEAGEPFIAMEYIEGDTLSQAVANRRESGEAIGLEKVFYVLAHMSEALQTIHEDLYHGVLTPYHVYLDEEGGLKISNLGFGREVATLMRRRGRGGAFVDSIYVAPEAQMSPDDLGRPGDLYSLAMIGGELLAERGLPDDREIAERITVEQARTRSEPLADLLEACLLEPPAERLADAEQCHRRLEEAFEVFGFEELSGASEGLPVEPAFGREPDAEEASFDLPSLGPPEPSGSESEERYIIRRDGLDYGPFTDEEVVEQLYEDDDVDEHVEVRDRHTQTSARLGEMDVFADEVEEYVSRREERQRKERERREEIERRVKQGGKLALVVSILAALGVLGGLSYMYFTRPSPEPVPFDKAIASMDYNFSPPPTDFQTVSVEDDVLEGIFNPNVSERAIAKKVERARGGSGGQGGDEGANVVDMSEGSGSRERLTNSQIKDIILSHFDALRDCILDKRDSDPSFKGVTVKFYIRPSGTTGGVGLAESRYETQPVGRCIIREFRTMKFPASSAVSKRGVTYPLEVRKQ